MSYEQIYCKKGLFYKSQLEHDFTKSNSIELFKLSTLWIKFMDSVTRAILSFLYFFSFLIPGWYFMLTNLLLAMDG